MKTQKDTLCQMGKNQMSPNLCDPRDFEVMEAGDRASPKMSAPFHNQCGRNSSEYKALLRDGERAANASNFNEAEIHPDVNNAGKPHTPGMSGGDDE